MFVQCHLECAFDYPNTKLKTRKQGLILTSILHNLRKGLWIYYLRYRLVVLPCLFGCFCCDPAGPAMVLCSKDRCRPPNCTCASHYHAIPDTKYRPQIVTITFDDAVTEYKFKAYRRLFNSKRRNPNGCPISATFFVSGAGGNRYDLVRRLYNDGHEIACHTVTHRMYHNASRKQFKKEIVGIRNLLVQKAGIPANEIRGMRAPYLLAGGDAQLQMMQEAGLLYDSTCKAGPLKLNSTHLTVWPFTWDYIVDQEHCDNNRRPQKSYPGIWELPLNRWFGLDGKPCAMMGGCKSTNGTENGYKHGVSGTGSSLNSSDVLCFLRKNFHSYHKRDRIPFGMHLHAAWFQGKEYRLEALEHFLDELLEHKDVYIVTMYQLVQWMQNQVSLNELDRFTAWQTSCKYLGKTKFGLSGIDRLQLQWGSSLWQLLLIIFMVLAVVIAIAKYIFKILRW